MIISLHLIATMLVVISKRRLLLLHYTNQIAITLIADGVPQDLVHRACRQAAVEVEENLSEGLYGTDMTLMRADLIFRIDLYIQFYK